MAARRAECLSQELQTFDRDFVPRADLLQRMSEMRDALLELNPQFVRGITPPGRVVTVRVPRGKGTLLAARYDTLPITDRITFVDHYVSRGQTLSDIARRYRVTVAMLQTANPRVKSHALRVGERIIVPMSGRIVPAAAWSVPAKSTSDAASLATWSSECVRGLRAYGRSSSIRSGSMLPGWKRRSVMKTLGQRM